MLVRSAFRQVAELIGQPADHEAEAAASKASWEHMVQPGAAAAQPIAVRIAK